MANNLFQVARINVNGWNALAAKDADTLYLFNDTKQIYFGEQRYGGAVEFVTEVPATGDLNTIYVVNAGLGGVYAYNGTAVVCIASPTADTISADSTNDTVAGAKAVYDYVTSMVGTGTNGLAKKPTYEAETRTITIPVVGDEDVVINLGKDLVVENGTLVEEEGKQYLQLTLTSGDIVKIDLNTLVDIYTGGSTASATVAVSEDNVITVAVKVSAAEGNILVVNDDGLFVPAAVPGEETLSGTANVIPSSAAVKTYVDALANGAVKTNTESIAAINNTETGILAQAKGYADTQDEATLGAAKAYTDELANGAVATSTAAIEAINNADTGILAQAKAYADAQDEATLGAAKTYAEGLVTIQDYTA